MSSVLKFVSLFIILHFYVFIIYIIRQYFDSNTFHITLLQNILKKRMTRNDTVLTIFTFTLIVINILTSIRVL